MSADNWASCPRCLARALTAFHAQSEKVAKMYGKVPVEEFDAARAELHEPDAREFITFREDYEIDGAETGVITISYSGNCRTCGLTLSFEDKKEIPGVSD